MAGPLFKLITLALLATQSIGVLAADTPLADQITDDTKPLPLPKSAPADSGPAGPPPILSNGLRVSASVHFPDSELGVKLVSGRAVNARLTLVNEEDAPVRVRLVGGSLWPLDVVDIAGENSGRAVRNLTVMPMDTLVAANGGNVTLPYGFGVDMMPTDLRLLLAAIVADDKGQQYQIEAFNGTVSVVDAPISMFDPQMLFLNVFLSALFGGTLYFIYTYLIKTFFPSAVTKSRSGRKPALKKKNSAASAGAASGAGSDSDRATTSAMQYDESWIPKEHLLRPEARRAKSSTPRTKAK